MYIYNIYIYTVSLVTSEWCSSSTVQICTGYMFKHILSIQVCELVALSRSFIHNRWADLITGRPSLTTKRNGQGRKTIKTYKKNAGSAFVSLTWNLQHGVLSSACFSVWHHSLCCHFVHSWRCMTLQEIEQLNNKLLPVVSPQAQQR